MHRATGGGFEGKFRHDMRRTTVHDASRSVWGGGVERKESSEAGLALVGHSITASSIPRHHRWLAKEGCHRLDVSGFLIPLVSGCFLL